MASDFTINERRVVRTERVGREQNPVIVIDDYLSNPGDLAEFAASGAQFATPNNWYPGLRAQPLPQKYIVETIRALHNVIGETFDLPKKGDVNANSYFGLTTTPPDQLAALQRLPHFDTPSPRQVAVLHYLCDISHGGTAFFRHRTTGYESITEARERSYFDRLDKELKVLGPRPARYVSGDDDLYEQIAQFDAKFNRAIVYRSFVLHSGAIDPASGLSRDPRTGRLTANLFLAYR